MEVAATDFNDDDNRTEDDGIAYHAHRTGALLPPRHFWWLKSTPFNSKID